MVWISETISWEGRVPHWEYIGNRQWKTTLSCCVTPIIHWKLTLWPMSKVNDFKKFDSLFYGQTWACLMIQMKGPLWDFLFRKCLLELRYSSIWKLLLQNYSFYIPSRGSRHQKAKNLFVRLLLYLRNWHNKYSFLSQCDS